MRSFRSSRAYTRSRLISFVALALMGHTAVPGAMAAQIATEAVISVERVGGHRDLRQVVTTRLSVPAHAQWQTDPDAGPMSVTVESGTLGVLLGGGSARIERRPDPLLGGHIGPLPPGHEVTLGSGDRLVIVRGFQLVVTNDADEPASAIVSRLRQAAAPTAYGSQ